MKRNFLILILLVFSVSCYEDELDENQSLGYAALCEASSFVSEWCSANQVPESKYHTVCNGYFNKDSIPYYAIELTDKKGIKKCLVDEWAYFEIVEFEGCDRAVVSYYYDSNGLLNPVTQCLDGANQVMYLEAISTPLFSFQAER